MASTSKKSSTPASQVQPMGGRPSNSLSPTRVTRLQEKADFQNLNDQLALYIDRVGSFLEVENSRLHREVQKIQENQLASYINRIRYLEDENSRLSREVEKIPETVTRQVSDIKSMYDNELSEARKLLDETFQEKRAKLEIYTKTLSDQNEQLKSDLAKKHNDLVLAENSVRVWETKCNELQIKYNQGNGDAKKTINYLKDVEKEIDKVKKQCGELRRQLEEASAARVDVENHNQTVKEEFSFKDQAEDSCPNCGTRMGTSPQRRRVKGQYVCNACGVYFNRTRVDRPEEVYLKVPKYGRSISS